MSKIFLLAFVLTLALVNCTDAIICYYRISSSASTNGTQIQTCTTSGSVCYSYMNGTTYMAGCTTGSCTATSATCTSCNTDYCNTLTPSVISCYTRTSADTTNGTMTVCATGTSTCYTQFGNGLSGCGICTSSYTQYYGCSTCNTNYCNTLTPSSIRCYTRNSTASISSNGTDTVCPTPVSTCYAHSDGEAGCGTCGILATANYGCTSCSGNYCNYRPIQCYTRSTTTSLSSSGTSITCPITSSSCYGLNDGAAGCGNCTFYSTSTNGCTSCTSNNCNTRPTPVKCYYTSGSSSYSSGVRTSCNTAPSCYEYSTFFFYYKGCGLCSTTLYSSCRNCYTDYCNYNTATITGFSAKTAVASAAMMLIMMKLF